PLVTACPRRSGRWPSALSTLADRSAPSVATDPAAVEAELVEVETDPGSSAAPRVRIPAVRAAGVTPARAGLRALVGAYVTLTNPRIVELLLVTTVPAMFLAAGRLPDLLLTVVVVVAGALAAGAANAFNCYIDRDIDQVMRRTSRRPLPAHTVSPRAALVFGLTLATVSTVLMAAFTTWLATVLTVAAIAYYDLVYTMWLKRTTP